MRGLHVQIELEVETQPYGKASIGYMDKQFVCVDVKDGKLLLRIGNSTLNCAPAEPTLPELKYLIATLQQAAEMMEKETQQ